MTERRAYYKVAATRVTLHKRLLNNALIDLSSFYRARLPRDARRLGVFRRILDFEDQFERGSREAAEETESRYAEFADLRSRNATDRRRPRAEDAERSATCVRAYGRIYGKRAGGVNECAFPPDG